MDYCYSIAFFICIVLIVVAFTRNQNMNYRTGKGLFESSKFNLDEKDDISDKEYYDGGGGLFK